MRFRVARHTNQLEKLIRFYTETIGLELLGSFQNHHGYDGVFLGLKNLDWEMEFTSTNEEIDHQPDEDDLLVFYTNSMEEYEEVLKKFSSKGIEKVAAKNPYWNLNGTSFLDPDGFGVVVAKPKRLEQ